MLLGEGLLMKKMQFLIMVVLLNIQTKAHYYGPYGHCEPRLYYIVQQQKIQEMQALRRTLAAPPVQVVTHYDYRNDHSQHTKVETINGGLSITHHAYSGKNPVKKPLKAEEPEASSWWQRYKDIFSRSGNQVSKVTSYFSPQKRAIAYKALVAGYIYINYRLFRLQSYLSNSKRWYFWKHDIPLAQLIAIPQADLAQDLIDAVNHRYTSSLSTETLSAPLAEFMKDLEEETGMLNSYQTITNILLKVDDIECQCLDSCCKYASKAFGFSSSLVISCIASKLRIKTLFYLDDALMNAIQDRLSRVAYLKNIFIRWLAGVKVAEARQFLKIDQDMQSDQGMP